MEKESVSTASEMRRIARLRESASKRKNEIADMIRWGLTPREIYEEGENDGRAIRVRTLGDVLLAVKECGLGWANILKESDGHATIRVFDSLCCRFDDYGNTEEKKCFYLAGFLAGAIQATGRSKAVTVQEMSCGRFGGDSCMFIASW